MKGYILYIYVGWHRTPADIKGQRVSLILRSLIRRPDLQAVVGQHRVVPGMVLPHLFLVSVKPAYRRP